MFPMRQHQGFLAVHEEAQLTTTEELRLEVHVIERVDGLVIVGLDLSCWQTVSGCFTLF